MLAVLSTHPIQYQAPVYRLIQQRFGVPVTAIYESDFSVAGYHDTEFNVRISWDTDLLSGYNSLFLTRTTGTQTGLSLGTALKRARPDAVLLTGYSPRFHQRAFYHAWRLGRPILFRGETIDPTRDVNPWKSRVRRVALRTVYARCSRLLYVGRRSYEHFKSMACPDEKLMLSPYCVDGSSFQPADMDRDRLRPEARKEMDLEESQITLLASGKLTQHKRPHRILNRAVTDHDVVRLRDRVAERVRNRGGIRIEGDRG